MKSLVYQVGSTNEKTLSIGFTAFLALGGNLRVFKSCCKVAESFLLGETSAKRFYTKATWKTLEITKKFYLSRKVCEIKFDIHNQTSKFY